MHFKNIKALCQNSFINYLKTSVIVSLIKIGSKDHHLAELLFETFGGIKN